MRGLPIIAGILALPVAASPAEAEVIEDHPVYIAAVAAGFAGGLGNSVAAIVYAAQGRSFHSAWVVSTLFSTAVCATFSGSLIYDSAQTGATPLGVVGMITFLAFSIWPTAWLVRSSISEVGPGQRFDSEVAPPKSEDPVEALGPKNRSPSAAVPVVAFTF